ncbi:hypothetical protein BH23CHL2_BH23CHL2_25290 [soil metagenome]
MTALSGPAGRWLLGRFSLPWPPLVDILAGAPLIAGGLIVAHQARSDLGDSLRVAPTPLEEAALVDRGWYGRVRHPLYLAVFLGVAGWAAIWMNRFVMGMAAVVVVYFVVKTRHEERMLLRTYPDYAEYMKRVSARFVPRIW